MRNNLTRKPISQATLNHRAPCAVKRAGIADGIGLVSLQPGNQKRRWRDPEQRTGLKYHFVIAVRRAKEAQFIA